MALIRNSSRNGHRAQKDAVMRAEVHHHIFGYFSIVSLCYDTKIGTLQHAQHRYGMFWEVLFPNISQVYDDTGQKQQP